MKLQLRSLSLLLCPHSTRLPIMAVLGISTALTTTSVVADTFEDNWKSVLDISTFNDDRTDDNANSGQTLWTIDAGADDYTQELERRYCQMWCTGIRRRSGLIDSLLT